MDPPLGPPGSQPPFGLSPSRLAAPTSATVLNRRLPKIEVSNEPFSTDFIEKQKDKAVSKLGISTQEVSYFVFDGKMKNMAYNLEQSPIILIDKNGGTKELLAGSDESNLKMLTKAVTKYYCCYPK